MSSVVSGWILRISASSVSASGDWRSSSTQIRLPDDSAVRISARLVVVCSLPSSRMRASTSIAPDLAHDLVEDARQRVRVLALAVHRTSWRNRPRIVVLTVGEEHDALGERRLLLDHPAIEIGPVAVIHLPVTDDRVEVLVMEQHDRGVATLDARHRKTALCE